MEYVQAFVTNMSFPREYEEWEQFFPADQPGGRYRYDIEKILYSSEEEWTAPKWCKKGDVAFFMFSGRSISNIAHLRSTYRKTYKERYSEEQRIFIEGELEILRELGAQYAGKIFAVGRVSGESMFDTVEEGYMVHWGSNIYAPIDGIQVLKRPVDISEFRDFLTICRGGAITPVVGDAFRKLKRLISSYNEIPEYYRDADATPTPLRSINRHNWLRINLEYRHGYFLEAQFRAFYVDYLLPELGDVRKIYSECRCVSDISNAARVDNVMRFYGKYLPVEVKLNCAAEADLPGQCKKYCHLKTMFLNKTEDLLAHGYECYEDHVVVIDTNSVFLYSYQAHAISHVISLDKLQSLADIEELRVTLRGLLPVDERAMRRSRMGKRR